MNKKINILISDQVSKRYEDLSYCFVLSKSYPYKEEAEKAGHSVRLMVELNRVHRNEMNLKGHSFNDAYEVYYKSMGLKTKSVSTPIKQALRVMKSGRYNGFSPIVDFAMRIEYQTLISFQVFDFSKISGDIQIEIADGSELFENSHGEIKHCKRNEIVLKDDAGVINSSYYGNKKGKFLSLDSEFALTKIMKVPGVPYEQFKKAMIDFCDQTESLSSIVIDANQKHGVIYLNNTAS